MKNSFFFASEALCGLRNITHKTGARLKATKTESNMAEIIVTANCL